MSQLTRLEASQRINGWLDPLRIHQDTGRDFLELSRMCSAEDHTPLTFRWDPKEGLWLWSTNPSFHIDTGPDILIDCHVDHFLHLVNTEGTKRKVLIPEAAQVTSKGYSQQVANTLPPSAPQKVGLDGQKGEGPCF